MRRFLADVRAAINEMFSPRIQVLSDEEQQTADEHSRVIAEWIGSHRHPPECAAGCRCGLWKKRPDGALSALRRHGFVNEHGHLTEAGGLVANWMAPR